VLVQRVGETRNAYTIFVGRPEAKKSLGSPKLRWNDNIKSVTYGIRVGRCVLNASGSERSRVVGSCDHGNDLSGSIKGG
jgi:hypothetical protein